MSDPYLRLDDSGRGDMFKCVICNTGSMHYNCLQSHLNGWYHTRALRDECFKNRSAAVDGSCIKDQIARLGLAQWRQHAKAELFDYIFSPGNQVCRVVDGGGVPSSITRLVKKYMNLEKTSLLELAVWKASCLSFDDSLSFHTMQDILDQWAMDANFDPVAYKAERRFTGNIAVIVRGVMEYIDEESY